jgi:hypothetical protein
MKGIRLCGECADYDMKKHRCKRGAHIEENPRNPFYDDCPLPDVVEVVRCKDCKHSFPLKDSTLQFESPYRYYKSGSILCGCEALMGDEPNFVYDTFFCGYGERKDNG